MAASSRTGICFNIEFEAAGMEMVFCQKCGGEPIHGKRICHACMTRDGDQRKRRERERYEAGLCVKCGEPRKDDRFRNCLECRIKYREKFQFETYRNADVEGEFVEPVIDGEGNVEIELHDGDPTNATPGSIDKVDVMMKRYEAGERLFHPKDEHRSQPVRHVRLDDDEVDDCDDF
jgi:hypothetical protein